MRAHVSENSRGDEDAPLLAGRIKKNGSGYFAPRCVFLLLAGVAATVAVTRTANWLSNGLNAAATSSVSELGEKASLSIRVKHPHYTTPASVLGGRLPWATVFEPHHEYELTLDGACDDIPVTWTVTEKQSDGAYEEVLSWVGTSAETAVLATKAGRAHALTATTAAGRMASINFMAKHVRRELRTLTDVDREAYFDTVAVVLSTPTKAGQEMFGMDFYGGEWFTRWHMTDQQQRNGGSFHTPWHDGPSFFTSHVAFTDYFERSMQSVNPKVAAHYWDFTVDAALEDWTTSVVWDDDWFGIGKDETDFVVGGRWSNIKHSVTMDGGGEVPSSTMHNSYGIETMSYNNNPAMKLTRAHTMCDLNAAATKLPGCSELTTALQASASDNILIQHALYDSLVHAKIHTLLGGFWSCVESPTTFLEAYPNAVVALTSILKIIPDLAFVYYFEEAIVCPGKCTIGETAFEDCMCSSKATLTDDTSRVAAWKQRFAAAIDSKSMHASTNDIRELLIKDENGTYAFQDLTDDENEALALLCTKLSYNPPKFSDFASPFSASFDPIFFATHANSEKFWTVVRLKKDDSEFVAHDKYWAAADLDTAADDDSFKGLNYDDPMMPFANAYGRIREPAGTYYTNRELMALYNPLQDSLPYIFDSLSYPHCGLGL